ENERIQGDGLFVHLPKSPHVFFMIFFLGRRTGQSVDQTAGILIVTEGQPVSLNCSYELTKLDNKAQGFQATHYEDKKKGTFSMRKPAIQLKDSSVFYCALTDTINSNTGSGYTKLILKYFPSYLLK
uniref:Immunoglobulin V-set domain-containing protein n=1 Tax=Laticauda laticaudata TaxID=8630 RepID=A0A8C5WSV6_LATLA